MHDRHLTPDRDTTGGYTLIELGVVLLLTSLMVFGMVRWMVGIGSSATSSLAGAADQRTALVFDQISKDLRSMRHCQPNGTDARIVKVSTYELIMIGDSDGDGQGPVETIVWDITPTPGDYTIRRGVAPMGQDCEPGEPAANGWADWLTGAQDAEFAVYRDGDKVVNGTASNQASDCDNELEQRCRVALIELVVDPSAGAAEERRILQTLLPQN